MVNQATDGLHPAGFAEPSKEPDQSGSSGNFVAAAGITIPVSARDVQM